nr:hypothetical protein [Tanacetum cinerariifolium]
EEPVTLDRPESPNLLLSAIQGVSDFISKCCLKEAFARSPNQYKEYLSEFSYTKNVLPDSKIWVSTPTGEVRGVIGVTTFRNALRAQYLSYSSMYVPPPFIITLEDLADILKDTRSAFFTPNSLTDDLIIVSDVSEEEENAENDKDTKDTSIPPLSPKSAQLQDCLPTELKELPLKIIGLSRDIKELKQHIKDMEIKLPGDLKEIPSKFETFTSTISNLLSQLEDLADILKDTRSAFFTPNSLTDDPIIVSDVSEEEENAENDKDTEDTSIPPLSPKSAQLQEFATLVENASRAITTGVPLTEKAIASPAKGEKDADTDLKMI